MTADPLVVRTHIGRDLLQTAQLFRTVEAATWEYVANGLEYVDPGVAPKITVDLDHRANRITVSDNGRGMNVAGLQQFFTMHGENLDRKVGKRGRGKFGTGKSAAFGIAKTLRVATRKAGLGQVVELRLEDVTASEGDEIPLVWIERDQPTGDPNGTVITIDRVLLARLQPEPVIKTVERHLAFWRAASPTVYVGTHLCEPWQPAVASTKTFRPSPAQAHVIGDVELVLHVTQEPLSEGLYGVAVTTAPGVWVAVETAGVESKEFGTYLFGEVEVPNLESSDGELAPYDLSRSLRLNPANPVAATLIGFIGYHLDSVRKTLVEEQRRLKKEQAYQQLDAAAARIAELLNEDLRSVADRLADIQAMRRRAGDVARAGGAGGGDSPGAWVEGSEEPGLLDPKEPAKGPGETHGGEDPGLARPGHPDPSGSDRVSPRGGQGPKPRPRGGLRVEYKQLGGDADRSVYDEAGKVILINLDHPMVAAALGIGGVEDIVFRRLSYEIAFGQYALAVSQEFLKRDPDLTADDVLYEVRDTLRRITRRAASLYEAVRG
jgi:Histidine kinase-, DNA gyrase B-, and HSP90-like ATPase